MAAALSDLHSGSSECPALKRWHSWAATEVAEAVLASDPHTGFLCCSGKAHRCGPNRTPTQASGQCSAGRRVSPDSSCKGPVGAAGPSPCVSQTDKGLEQQPVQKANLWGLSREGRVF